MTATSQKFDTLDGLVVTGSMEVGANLAVDTNVLFVDTVNNRVGINDSSPSYPLDVVGTAQITGGLYIGTNITHVGDTDTTIGFSNNQIDITAGNANIASANTTMLSINAGDGIQVRGVSPTSTFATNTEKADGGIGVNSINTSMILSQDDTATGIIFGALTNDDVPDPNFGGTWSSTSADEISIIIGDRRRAYFDNDGLHFSNLSASDNTIDGVDNVGILSSITHSGDVATKLEFDATASIRLVSNGSERLKVNATQTYISGDLDVTTDIMARRIQVEDYFKETVVAASTGNSVNINVNSGSVYTFTPNANYSVDFTNFPTAAGEAAAFTLVIDNNGTAREATWPGELEGDAIYWAESVEPPSSSGIDIYNFVVIAGKIYGSLSIRNAGWAQ